MSSLGDDMEDRYIEIHKTWNKVAHLYEHKFMALDLYNDTYKKFCDLLSTEKASILDLGSGPGNIIRYILSINPKLQIIATDVSDNMIALAKKNNPSIEAKVLDCRNLSTINNTFDGIICGFVIPYLSLMDVQCLIAECVASLNENGILYLSFVEGDYGDSGYIIGSTGDRSYFYYYDFKTIKKVLTANNLLVQDHYSKKYEKADNSIEIHTIIIAKRISEL